MYLPRHFRVDDPGAAHGLMRAHALGTLVASIDGSLEASHVPVVLDAQPAPYGRLRFHLARANPLVAALDGGCEALFAFVGENAYVSPDWYATEHRVPTWNYAAAHAYGRPAPLDDDALCALLDDLSAERESRLDKRPWTAAKLPPETYARMRRAIVGFEMPIERIEAKWKMDQHRGEADLKGAADALAALGTAGATATAATMHALLDAMADPAGD